MATTPNLSRRLMGVMNIQVPGPILNQEGEERGLIYEENDLNINMLYICCKMKGPMIIPTAYSERINKQEQI